jgi:hypothetical protein
MLWHMNLNLLILVEQAFTANLQDLHKAKQIITNLLFVIDNPDNSLTKEKRAEFDDFLQRRAKTLQIKVELGEL